MIYIVLFSTFIALIITAMYLFTYKLSFSRDNSSSKQLLNDFTPEDSNQSLNDMVNYFKTHDIVHYEI